MITKEVYNNYVKEYKNNNSDRLRPGEYEILLLINNKIENILKSLFLAKGIKLSWWGYENSMLYYQYHAQQRKKGISASAISRKKDGSEFMTQGYFIIDRDEEFIKLIAESTINGLDGLRYAFSIPTVLLFEDNLNFDELSFDKFCTSTLTIGTGIKQNYPTFWEAQEKYTSLFYNHSFDKETIFTEEVV